jgi:exosortase/archaeosortase family protein
LLPETKHAGFAGPCLSDIAFSVSKRAKRNQTPSSNSTGAGKAGPRCVGGRLRTWYAGKSPVVHFAGKFGLLLVLYYVVVLIPFFDRLFYGYLCASARVGGALLNLLGHQVEVLATSIRSANYGINVRRGCDAIEPFWFYAAGVLASPMSFARKLPGILAGAALILTLNLVRIVSLFLIGCHAPGFFDTAHLEIWPVVFIVTSIALWIGWMSWAKRTSKTETYVAA